MHNKCKSYGSQTVSHTSQTIPCDIGHLVATMPSAWIYPEYPGYWTAPIMGFSPGDLEWKKKHLKSGLKPILKLVILFFPN